MRKVFVTLCMIMLVMGIATVSFAGKPVDADNDGFNTTTDCNDTDATVYPGAVEILDGKDNDCNGLIDDGVTPPNGHEGLTWQGNGTCLPCHMTEAQEMFGTAHYQWKGETPYMVNGPQLQGKLLEAVNSYCINIMGNWGGCGACHVGRGIVPEATETTAQLENIDCLICHQKDYKRKKDANGNFIPDTANMTITMDQAVQTVHRPMRQNCVQCHAKGGGGDNYKRGDMAMAHANTNDRDFDVHMATTGANLLCQDCHATVNHAMAGKGSDLRPTELDQPILCSTSTCHIGKSAEHGVRGEITRHLGRVACQTCHISTSARNAADTAASEATEMHRTWLEPHLTSSGAWHPTFTFESNIKPEYKFWNGYSDNYVLYDNAVIDPVTGAYPTSRPMGSLTDGKLYPFKYKTAEQPLADTDNVLIALDTKVYFAGNGAVAATTAGLANMGLASQSYTWVYTDTYQLLTHEIGPAATNALDCTQCHNGGSQMDLAAMGYVKKADFTVLCVQCHGMKNYRGWEWVHDRHVASQQKDCSWCHDFSRPERGLTMP